MPVDEFTNKKLGLDPLSNYTFEDAVIRIVFNRVSDLRFSHDK